MMTTCSCGKPSSHTIYDDGFKKFQCCECYIKAGNPPADWHPLCMKTYNEMMTSERLKRRVFLLSGWRRWLATKAPDEHAMQKSIIESRKGGNWAVLVANDCAALEYQRLEFRNRRASGRCHNIQTYRDRAHHARRVANDVRMFLRPGGDDGLLWDETFSWIWFKAPVQCYVNQDKDDGSWYIMSS